MLHHHSKLETGRAGDLLLGKLLKYLSFPIQVSLPYKKLGSCLPLIPDSSAYTQDSMMPSLVYQILSLITIVIFSLAQQDDFDFTAGNFAQSLTDPVASLDGSPALDLGEADVSGKIPDVNGLRISQAAVIEPDAHGCSNGRKRRRGDENFCPSTDTKPPSSQQAKPQNSDEQPSNGETGQQKEPETPQSMPVVEAHCPEGHFPMCAAPSLLEDPIAPGKYTIIRWLGHNIPQTIDIEEYSRFCPSI